MLNIQLKCPRGHQQTLRLRGEVDSEGARYIAQVLDGTSEVYMFHPIEGGPARCAFCYDAITATVENDAVPSGDESI